MKPLKFTQIEQIPAVLELRDIINRQDRQTNLQWGLSCLADILDKATIDPEIQRYIDIVSSGNISVKEARKMAQITHRYARESEDLALQFCYRAIGHCIATIHVNTHAYGIVIYGQKYVHQLGLSDDERIQLAEKWLKKIS